MNKNGNFAVVRRPSSAVEKAVPGAKRILSGMVADALALAKKQPPTKRVIRVLTCTGDQDMSEFWQEIIQEHLGSGYTVEVTDKGEVTTILELVNKQSFDIIIPLINNILAPIPVDFDGNYFENRVRKAVELFTRLKAQFDIPIIALCGAEPNFNLPERLKLGGIDAFFWYAQAFFDSLHTEFLPALETALKIKIPRGVVSENEIISLKSRPLNRRGTLLVVDDEENLRDMLGVIFKDEYDLFMAGDGEAAIELAQQHDIDVVVTNINLPRMSGYDVLERLKYMRLDIEVMMMSGMDTTDSRRMAFQLGACDYIPKPFDLPTIRAAVSKAMQRRMRESEITAARKTSSSNTDKFTDQPLQTRPLEIIHVGVNANWLLEVIKAVIFQKYKNATVKTYTDGDLAWQELLRQEPDLLISTILRDRGIDGYDMISKLATRKAKFPILVYDGLMNIATENHVQQLAGPNLKVSCLYCPFTAEQFFNGLSKLLDNK
jgi:DNA-binding response OmpR family regulator